MKKAIKRDRHDHFSCLVREHVDDLRRNGGTWGAMHVKAWDMPRPEERGIRDMIRGYALMCDAYRQPDWREGDHELGDDGYFWEHAKDLILAMRAYLNLDCGRFDCGSLDTLICKLAEESGVELDEPEPDSERVQQADHDLEKEKDRRERGE